MPTSLPVRCAAIAILASTAVAQVDWTQLAATGPPPFGSGFAWDGARNRLVTFGGSSGGPVLDATTEWDGTSWVVSSPVVRPPARIATAMAFDAARAESVLFGGTSGPVTLLGDTWTWNGTAWTQRFPAIAPSPRMQHAMAYDPVREVVVLFGGWIPTATGQLDSDETWEWDGAAWSLRTSAGATPLARHETRMVFDAARGVVVMCGGYGDANQATLADTWTWNGAVWTQVASLPGAIDGHVLAYDAARRRVVAWGGRRVVAGSAPTFPVQAYEWDGSAWTARATATVPAARVLAVHGYDPVGHRVVMGGGIDATAGGAQPDTLAYAPTTPGAFATFGAGCASSAGGLELQAMSLPYAGGAFVQRIANAPPTATLAVVAYGLSHTSWNGQPLPFALAALGAPGCAVLVSVDTTVTVPLAGGSGTTVWNVPALPALVGAPFFLQALVLDPQSASALPIGLSSGRAAAIGAP